jgi:hypothetical protein
VEKPWLSSKYSKRPGAAAGAGAGAGADGLCVWAAAERTQQRENPNMACSAPLLVNEVSQKKWSQMEMLSPMEEISLQAFVYCGGVD